MISLFTGILIILIVIMSSIGSVLIKIGSKKVVWNGKVLQMIRSALNISLISGAFLYFVQALFFVFLLKSIDLSILFPIVASLNYITVIIISFSFLKEKINKYKIMGTLLIIIGVVIISL